VTVDCNSPEQYLTPATWTFQGPAVLQVFYAGQFSEVSENSGVTGSVNLELDGNASQFASYLLAPPVQGQNPGLYPLITWVGSVGAGSHTLAVDVNIDPLSSCDFGSATANTAGVLQATAFPTAAQGG
jgi:hypothetical protein